MTDTILFRVTAPCRPTGKLLSPGDSVRLTARQAAYFRDRLEPVAPPAPEPEPEPEAGTRRKRPTAGDQAAG